MTASTNRRSIAIVLGALLLAASSCGLNDADEQGQAVIVVPAQQDDDRTLEERVDTDGDGEMSDEEIETYARATILEFSDCMRSNGYPDFTDVVLEDFTEGEGGQGRFLSLMAERGVNISDPNAIPTLQLCGENLSDLQTFAPQPSDAEVAEREAQLLEFAACMRDQGLSGWPDPDFAANPSGGYGPELLQQFDIESDEVQDAGAACQAEGNGFAFDESELDEDEEQEDDTNAEPEPADDEDVPSEADDRTAISPLIEGDTSDLNTAEVVRRDLVQTTTLSGTLGFGDQEAFPTNTTGIITALPSAGDIIDIGAAVFSVDNEPVLLFEGDLPQYRTFTNNMSDGADIQQLEENLVRFGWADDFDLTVDDDFTAVTRDVIEAMQEELGVEETGRIELGDVVFHPSPIRVGTVNAVVGQSINPQVTVLSVSESDQRITLQLDAEDRALVSVGTEVDVELPDGTVTPGSVSDVASIATRTVNPQTGAQNDPTIEVTIRFETGPSGGLFDAAPVDIVLTDAVIADVLTVPVPALVALSGGGHAVELIVQGGTQLIAVELGDFVDDIVEISGDVQEGDLVVMASAN